MSDTRKELSTLELYPNIKQLVLKFDTTLLYSGP